MHDMSNTGTAADPDSTDPSATMWWATQTAVPRPAEPASTLPRPAPNTVGVTLLLLLSAVITLFAPVCWGYANHQLAMIKSGQLSDSGRGLIAVSRGIAIFLTVLLITMIVCGVIVMVSSPGDIR